MPVLLAALWSGLVALVVVYCLAGVAVPGRWASPVRHRRDIDAWHVVMGVAMVGMLLGHLSRPMATGALVLAGLAVCWGALSTERRSGSSAHVRLLVSATAMAVMTLPLAAPAEAVDTGPASGGRHAMSLGGSSALLVVMLLAALAGVALTRLPAVVRRGSGAVSRLDACCDVVMAGAMAALLAALL